MSENKFHVQMVCLEDVPAVETKWLWYPYIPLGKITIIQGDPGEGKSTLALNIAAAVSMGFQFPDRRKLVSLGDTVICQNAEDGLNDTVKPRLERAGADCRMVLSIDESKEGVSLTDPRLHWAMMEYRPKLVILDPLQAYLGSDVDMHRANEVRPLMSLLAETAEASGAAVVLIGHMNKAFSMGKAIYRGLGSIDITAAARSVLLVARDPDRPENRVILQIKNSLAPEGEPVAFTLDADNKFKFLGAYPINPAVLLSGGAGEHSESQLDRAKRLIGGWLANEGMLPATEIAARAEAEGLSMKTMHRAKNELGVRAEKTQSGWLWLPPDKKQDGQDGQDGQNITCENLSPFAPAGSAGIHIPHGLIVDE